LHGAGGGVVLAEILVLFQVTGADDINFQPGANG